MISCDINGAEIGVEGTHNQRDAIQQGTVASSKEGYTTILWSAKLPESQVGQPIYMPHNTHEVATLMSETAKDGLKYAACTQMMP
jgi:hypothetical protein